MLFQEGLPWRITANESAAWQLSIFDDLTLESTSLTADCNIHIDYKYHFCSELLSVTMDMASINNSSDPKSAIVKQLQQEAAMNNARQLINVTSHFLFFRGPLLRLLSRK